MPICQTELTYGVPFSLCVQDLVWLGSFGRIAAEAFARLELAPPEVRGRGRKAGAQLLAALERAMQRVLLRRRAGDEAEGADFEVHGERCPWRGPEENPVGAALQSARREIHAHGAQPGLPVQDKGDDGLLQVDRLGAA